MSPRAKSYTVSVVYKTRRDKYRHLDLGPTEDVHRMAGLIDTAIRDLFVDIIALCTLAASSFVAIFWLAQHYTNIGTMSTGWVVLCGAVVGALLGVLIDPWVSKWVAWREELIKIRNTDYRNVRSVGNIRDV